MRKSGTGIVKKTQHASFCRLSYGLGNYTAAVLEEISKQTDRSRCIAFGELYYNKPSQEGIIRHFSFIADKAQFRVILYNVPGRTSSNLSAGTTLRLAGHERLSVSRRLVETWNSVAKISERQAPRFMVKWRRYVDGSLVRHGRCRRSACWQCIFYRLRKWPSTRLQGNMICQDRVVKTRHKPLDGAKRPTLLVKASCTKWVCGPQVRSPFPASANLKLRHSKCPLREKKKATIMLFFQVNCKTLFGLFVFSS